MSNTVQNKDVIFEFNSILAEPGVNNVVIETLNCLLARQLCYEDPACLTVLQTIPSVCGIEIGK